MRTSYLDAPLGKSASSFREPLANCSVPGALPGDSGGQELDLRRFDGRRALAAVVAVDVGARGGAAGGRQTEGGAHVQERRQQFPQSPKGASRYDIRQIFGFFDPFPLVRICN